MSDIKERLRAFDSFAVNPKICKEAADHIATLEKESSANLQRALVAEKKVKSLEYAANQVLGWTEVKHRPPIRDLHEIGKMVMVRLHALADLHNAISAPDTSTQEVG